MLSDGLKLLQSSTAENLIIEKSTVLPTTDNVEGRLFFQQGVGLMTFSEGAWTKVGDVTPDTIRDALGFTPAALDANGQIDAAQLPPLAITDTSVVGSEAEMLALTADVGDVAVRTDLNQSFILRALPAATVANWQRLLTPPNDVVSVNGRTGAVVLSTTDVAEGANLYFTTARARSAIAVTGFGSYDPATGAITINQAVTSVNVTGGTTGLTTTGGPITGAGEIALGGTLGVANGGTGQATAAAAFNSLAPAQTGNDGKYLRSDGTAASWQNLDVINPFLLMGA